VLIDAAPAGMVEMRSSAKPATRVLGLINVNTPVLGGTAR